MGDQLLLFRERHGLATIVAVTLQCVLERRSRLSDMDVEDAMREIEGAVGAALAAARGRLHPRNVGTTSATAGSLPSTCDSMLLHQAALNTSPQPSSWNGRPRPNLPAEVLRRMMTYLTDVSCSYSRGCLSALTAASGVCQHWRSVALLSPKLWSDVHCSSPGEMAALETILRRSAKTALPVDLDFRRVPEQLISAAVASVVGHMHRIKSLVLRDDGAFVRTYDTLCASRAPMLQELHLYSPRVQLRTNFLDGHAPHLKVLTLGVHYFLPRFCPALATITTLRLLDHSSDLTVAETAHLKHLCPNLKSLRLDFTMRDAPRGAAFPLSGLRGLRELTLSEVGADGVATLMTPTLRLFDFAAVRRVRLRVATTSTAGFLAKDILGGVDHLFFARPPGDSETGVVLLSDKALRKRTFSELNASTFDYLLAKAWAVSSQLTSLCVSDRLAACDAAALADLAFPALRFFSVFVRGAPSSTDTDCHIFDIPGATRRAWTFPALEDVRFATTPPARDPDVFPDISARPELSATALRQFYADMIQRGVKRKPSLTMVGVGFSERFAGPEVSALRATFSAVQFTC